MPEKEKSISLLKVLQVAVLLSVLLYFGRTLFIPLSFSLLISCILYPFCLWMEKKGAYKSVAIAIAIITLVLFVSGVVYLMFQQVTSFADEWQQLKIKLEVTFNQLASYLASQYNISLEQQQRWLNDLADRTGMQVIPFLRTTLYSLSVSIVLMILIPVFSVLILYHREQLFKVLHLLFPSEKITSLREILHETIHTYTNFIKGMAIVYLIVGILNSIGLAIIGVSHPVLFGFIASILTFIPYVGIMVAALLPMAVSWIEYNSVWYPFGVIVVFTVVQYLEANVIFPLAVSNRLKINTLVTIAAIIAGGILWGAAGMILFIPYLGILKLIADRTGSMKAISMLLSTENGPPEPSPGSKKKSS